MDFKRGIYQRLTAGEWLVYHFAKDIASIHGADVWDDIAFFSLKHATRLQEFLLSLGVVPLPPRLWYIYSPAPPINWYEALFDRDLAFSEMYEVVIGFSEFYARLVNRYGFTEEFLERHRNDWDDAKRKMRHKMGR